MPQRAVIWAAVSSRPQAETDSIDQQVADGRALVQRQGWSEVAVLVVPGESRSYIDVADAIAGLDERLQPGEDNAYRRLLALLASRACDVLVVRARDRLGRTDALIAGVEERCRRAGVLLWSLAMPPSGSEAGDLYVSAVERAGAQREIVELLRRHREGMDGRARRGLMVGPEAPFGYAVEHVQVGRRFERRAVVVEAEAAAYRQAIGDVIAHGSSERVIVERLRAQFPSRRWPISAFYGTFRNPFHIGLIVRRRKRADGETAALRVIDPGNAPIFSAPEWPQVEALLATRAGRDYVANIDKAGRRRLTLVAPGLHTAIVDLSTWMAMQRETELRAEMRRPPARSSLWSGMARCGLCGNRLNYHYCHMRKGGREYIYHYYRCSHRDARFGSCANEPVKQHMITAGVAQVLGEIYARMAGQVEALLGAGPAPGADPLAGLLAQQADLAAQRERLEILAQTGRITFDAFDERAAKVDAALSDVAARLAHEQTLLQSRDLAQARFLALAELLPGLEERLEQAEPAVANRWLREMIEAVIVSGGRVTEIRMRI